MCSQQPVSALQGAEGEGGPGTLGLSGHPTVCRAGQIPEHRPPTRTVELERCPQMPASWACRHSLAPWDTEEALALMGEVDESQRDSPTQVDFCGQHSCFQLIPSPSRIPQIMCALLGPEKLLRSP